MHGQSKVSRHDTFRYSILARWRLVLRRNKRKHGQKIWKKKKLQKLWRRNVRRWLG